MAVHAPNYRAVQVTCTRELRSQGGASPSGTRPSPGRPQAAGAAQGAAALSPCPTARSTQGRRSGSRRTARTGTPPHRGAKSQGCTRSSQRPSPQGRSPTDPCARAGVPDGGRPRRPIPHEGDHRLELVGDRADVTALSRERVGTLAPVADSVGGEAAAPDPRPHIAGAEDQRRQPNLVARDHLKADDAYGVAGAHGLITAHAVRNASSSGHPGNVMPGMSGGSTSSSAKHRIQRGCSCPAGQTWGLAGAKNESSLRHQPQTQRSPPVLTDPAPSPPPPPAPHHHPGRSAGRSQRSPAP